MSVCPECGGSSGEGHDPCICAAGSVVTRKPRRVVAGTPVPDPSPRALETILEGSEGTLREVPIGLAEIAVLLEVKRDTVDKWRHRGVLPEPDLIVSGTPLWWQDTIRGWAEHTGRMPGPI